MNISEFTEQHLQYTTPNYSANATRPKICVVVSQAVCNDTIDGCCIGYYRASENNKCEKCMPGYIGLNCTYKCPFPYYGENCKNICNCSNKTCDVATGCTAFTNFTYLTMAIEASSASFESWTVERLKKELITRGASTKGRKTYLVESIYPAIA
uniref:SAP domain-containing protein n=1 Tax=Magallana gigas TaxID=29159 RepID=A0A8W8JRR0_MAGGI